MVDYSNLRAFLVAKKGKEKVAQAEKLIAEKTGKGLLGAMYKLHLLSDKEYSDFAKKFKLVEKEQSTIENIEANATKTLEEKIKSPQTFEERKTIEDVDIFDAVTIQKKSAAEKYPRTAAQSAVSPEKGAVPAKHKEIFDKSRYKYVEQIGKGGMGVVELYNDTKFGIDVAVKHILAKEITQDRKDRFSREMRLQGRFAGNPHVVRALDLGYDDKNDLYFVMEFIKGKTLKDMIEELVEEKAKDSYLLMNWLELFLKIAETVGKVHEEDIIHRDIKPENIMILDEYNYPKLMDFGLAKDLKEAKELLTGGTDLRNAEARMTGTFLTQQGTIAGTPIYMAPEQALDSTKVDARADIYSLGAILYEILTGVPPHIGESGANTIHKKLNEETILPSKAMPLFKINPALDAICMRALAKEKYKRYQTTQAFASDLRAFIHNEPLDSLTYKQPIAERIGRKIQKHPTTSLGIGAAALLTLASIVGGVIYSQNIQTARAKAELAEKDKKLAEKEKERAKLEAMIASKERDAAVAEVKGQSASQAKLDSLKFLRQDEGYYDAALSIINQAINDSPEYWGPYLFRAKHLAEAGRHEEAEKDFLKANSVFKKQFGKESTEIWFEAGMFYGLPAEIGGKGEEDKALEHFKKASADKSAFGRLAKAASLMIEGKLKPETIDDKIPEAIKITEELVEDEIAKNMDATYLTRAWILGSGVFELDTKRQRKKPELLAKLRQYTNLQETKKALLHVVNENEGNLTLRSFLGAVYSMLGEQDKAIDIYTKILEVRKIAKYYSNRGGAYFKKKAYDKTLEDFNEAIRLDPRDASFYNNKGSVLVMLGKLDDAINAYNITISIDPEYSTAYYNRGFMYHLKGERDKAIADCMKCLEIDPSEWLALSYMGSVKKEEGKLEESLKYYKEAFKQGVLAPDSEKEEMTDAIAWLEEQLKKR